MSNNTFIEKHGADATDNSILLAFAKSIDVQAYPCGRRRSNLVDKDGNSTTVDDKYYIPFDPEARLNTENNNRKHTSLNGFTQSFVNNFDNGVLSIVIAGYSFEITTNYTNLNDLGNELETFLDESSKNAIYANIRIDKIALFENDNFTTYYTKILRNQSTTDAPATELDSLKSMSAPSIKDMQDYKNYYFSGLSFSFSPLSEDTSTNIVSTVTKGSSQIISLKILNKTSQEWRINEAARLPKIEHGDTTDSVRLEKLEVTNFTATSAVNIPYNYKESNSNTGTQKTGNPAVVKVKELVDNATNKTTYQLQFFNSTAN